MPSGIALAFVIHSIPTKSGHFTDIQAQSKGRPMEAFSKFLRIRGLIGCAVDLNTGPCFGPKVIISRGPKEH